MISTPVVNGIVMGFWKEFEGGLFSMMFLPSCCCHGARGRGRVTLCPHGDRLRRCPGGWVPVSPCHVGTVPYGLQAEVLESYRSNLLISSPARMTSLNYGRLQAARHGGSEAGGKAERERRIDTGRTSVSKLSTGTKSTEGRRRGSIQLNFDNQCQSKNR